MGEHVPANGSGQGRVVTILLSPRTRLVVLGVLVVGLSVAFAVLGGPGPDRVTELVTQAGPTAPVAFVVVYAVLVVLLFPASVLTIAAGVVFGVLWGTLLAALGATIGAIGAYLVGRRLGREQVARLSRGRLRGLDRWLGERGFVAVLYARLLPIVPFNLFNYAAAVTSIGFRDYVLATTLGILPGTFAYAALGGSFSDPTSPDFLIAVGLILVLAVAGPIADRLLRRRRRASGTDEHPSETR